MCIVHNENDGVCWHKHICFRCTHIEQPGVIMLSLSS